MISNERSAALLLLAVEVKHEIEHRFKYRGHMQKKQWEQKLLDLAKKALETP